MPFALVVPTLAPRDAVNKLSTEYSRAFAMQALLDKNVGLLQKDSHAHAHSNSNNTADDGRSMEYHVYRSSAPRTFEPLSNIEFVVAILYSYTIIYNGIVIVTT